MNHYISQKEKRQVAIHDEQELKQFDLKLTDIEYFSSSEDILGGKRPLELRISITIPPPYFIPAPAYWEAFKRTGSHIRTSCIEILNNPGVQGWW